MMKTKKNMIVEVETVARLELIQAKSSEDVKHGEEPKVFMTIGDVIEEYNKCYNNEHKQFIGNYDSTFIFFTNKPFENYSGFKRKFESDDKATLKTWPKNCIVICNENLTSVFSRSFVHRALWQKSQFTKRGCSCEKSKCKTNHCSCCKANTPCSTLCACVDCQNEPPQTT